MFVAAIVEDAIQGRISKMRTEFSGNNSVIVRARRIRIGTLIKAPWDLESIKLAIGERKSELEKARKLEEMQMLDIQIETLEFKRRMIIFKKQWLKWG